MPAMSPAKDSERKMKRVQEYLRQIKRETGCRVCGESDPLALDFHHKPEEQKEINLSEARTWRKAQHETKKCVVMCANCHRKSHGFLRPSTQKVGQQKKFF